MDYCIIDGKAYDVYVDSIQEYFNVTDTDNSGRAIANGRMIRDVIGTFIGHKVKFRRKGDNFAEYDSLCTHLMQPYESVNIKIAHNQETIEYEAYATNGQREVERIDRSNGTIYWKALEINFVPMEAQITP